MKMDSKTKAARNPAKLKTNNLKHRGNDIGKKPSQSVTPRTEASKGQLLINIEEGTRQTQEESIGSRQRLLATYEHAPIGIIENSPEGNYVNCNEEFCRITGYQKEELLTLNIKDLTYEEDYIFDIKLHQRLVAGDIPFYKLEKRYVRKDGKIIWAEVTRSLVRDADGRPLYTVGTVLDVSERKRVELEIRNLSRLPAENPNPVMRLTPDGNVLYANHASATLLEFWKQQIDQTITDELKNYVAEVFASGLKKEIEIEQNGKTFSCTLAPIREAGYVNFYGNDITERKRAEEALRQSEERFARFMQHLPGLAWIKDVQGRYVYANAAAEKAFSSPREKLYGKTDQDLFPPEVAAQFKKNDERALMEGKGVQVIETLEHDDGVLHYSLVSKFPIPGSDGNTALIGGTAFDITERKQVEEAMRDSEQRFRAIINQATAGIVRKDAEGSLIYVNQAFCDMLGYTESELIGKAIWQLMHNEDIEENKRLFNRMMAEDISFQLEKRLIRRDGSILWANISISAVLNAEGKPQSAVAVVVDITGRKQAEEALQQLNLQLESRVQSRTEKLNNAIQALRDEISERQRAEAQLVYQARLIANVNDAIIATDENLAIGYWNQAAEQIYGWKAEEVMGRSATEVLQSEFMDGNTRSEALQKVKETGELRTAVTHLRKDGTRIFIDAHTSTLRNEEGKTVGYISINHDVTERTQAEEALHKSRESLRKLSKRLVEVQEDERRAIARELHDRVGQTLAALNINLMIMNGQLLEDSKQRIGSRLNDSMHLVAEAIALVRNIMTDLRPAVLDDYGLEAALQSYIDEYESRYDIKVLLDPSDQSIPRLDPSVEMTLLRIAQEALTNVARHAQAGQVNVSLQLADHSVHLTVQDNGVGIESWQRANQPGSHGMRIMRERAEAFGGSLNVGSTPGNGTKVEARIPVGSGGQHKVQEEKE